jgi:predicted amidohydrolase
MKLAIVQDGPVFNNLKESIAKTCAHIEAAAKEKADLIVFGESWLSGYPVWLDVCKDVNLWDHEPIKSVWADMFNNSVDVSSDELNPIKKLLAENNMYATIGINEKVLNGKGNNTIYNSLLIINDSGQLINHHRKLMPTYTEKLVHGLGDGAGLNSVDTPFGRLGGLICWEHWMPLTRQAMHDQGEDLHIGVWPFAKGMHHLASRTYAIEGRCHVVAVGQIMHKDELPNGMAISDSIEIDSTGLLLRGGSAIYGPDGESIIEPIYNKRKLIYSELDLKTNTKEYMNLAVSGHYQRPDVFGFEVNKKR